MRAGASAKMLSSLLIAAGAEHDDAASGLSVSGVAYDSRTVRPGDLFVAVTGALADGHLYLSDAARSGAVAALVERLDTKSLDVIPQYVVGDSRVALALVAACFYEYPSKALRLVGITGTNGKTTTAHLVENILSAAGLPTGVLGTVEYRFAGVSLAAARTTPESADLQRMLFEMSRRGARAAAIEVSSHALELGRLLGCEFDTIVFTNLSPEHLDYHKDMETYFAAKSRLFDNAVYPARRYVINVDDAYGRRLAALCPRDKSITYGKSPGCDVRLVEYDLLPEGVSLNVSISGKELEFTSRLKGSLNVENVLAAVGVGVAFELEPAVISLGLKAAGGVKGRFQTLERGQDFNVIVDYAHTPDGLEKLLESARLITPGRIILVFGCGGDRDKSKRPLMGGIGARLSDVYVITSDNPRGEDPEAIIADVRQGISGSTTDSYAIVDRREAIALAVGMARRGDTVLIAGKGHETGQIFADRTIPFDDVQVTSQILDKR